MKLFLDFLPLILFFGTFQYADRHKDWAAALATVSPWWSSALKLIGKSIGIRFLHFRPPRRTVERRAVAAHLHAAGKFFQTRLEGAAPRRGVGDVANGPRRGLRPEARVEAAAAVVAAFGIGVGLAFSSTTTCS